MDIQSISKDAMYPSDEYLTSAQSNTILSHNWIETNIHCIKGGIIRTKHENIKLSNGDASSSALIEDLASHVNKRQKKIKWNHYKMKAYKEWCLKG